MAFAAARDAHRYEAEHRVHPKTRGDRDGVHAVHPKTGEEGTLEGVHGGACHPCTRCTPGEHDVHVTRARGAPKDIHELVHEDIHEEERDDA